MNTDINDVKLAVAKLSGYVGKDCELGKSGLIDRELRIIPANKSNHHGWLIYNEGTPPKGMIFLNRYGHILPIPFAGSRTRWIGVFGAKWRLECVNTVWDYIKGLN